ncbi:MAG TPA: bifunctional demethylmenaquinone methyltransferase/2-methoxy-6-polyprenyl-1,4-benzoquinol methylase UbiE [Paludibacter sp.]|nr:bifunctional demethylmenaquinone methyltransferase/2-methoxy-6-polyprenyl-1,4-benzoquinol methylase UbiE [Paludibacter sp.]
MQLQNKNSTSEFTKVKPYNEQEAKTLQLSRMFNTISGQYDRFNDIMSWGMARVWRKKALLSLKPYNPKLIIDIATGTGDFSLNAFKYLHPEHITAVDISDKMIEVGVEKVKKAGLAEKIEFGIQDCSTLSFGDNSYDAATIAFGIRNFEKLNESLQQIHRVLKPNGHLLILEMNEPQKGLLLKGYQIYTRIFVRMTSKFLSSDKRAYDYLTSSMKVFANGKQLIEILAANNFKLDKYKKFTFGVCSMYLVSKAD